MLPAISPRLVENCFQARKPYLLCITENGFQKDGQMHPVIPANYIQVMGTKLCALTQKRKKSSFTDNYTFTQSRDLEFYILGGVRLRRYILLKSISSICIKGILHNQFTILMLINVCLQELPRQQGNIAPGSKCDTSSQNFYGIKSPDKEMISVWV